MAIFLVNPGYPVLLKPRVMEVVRTTGTISRAKLQPNHQHQQTNTQCFTGRMPFLSPKGGNNTVDNKLVLIIFGIIQHPEEIRHQKNINVPTHLTYKLLPHYLGFKGHF